MCVHAEQRVVVYLVQFTHQAHNGGSEMVEETPEDGTTH